jgi:hypothetical protein
VEFKGNLFLFLLLSFQNITYKRVKIKIYIGAVHREELIINTQVPPPRLRQSEAQGTITEGFLS